MPLAPVHRLRKDEIVWLSQHRCPHGHSFLEHYNCFLAENPDKERIGFFDIETSHLAANMGVLLSYCILDDKTDEIFYSVIDGKDIRNKKIRDYKVVKNCIRDLLQFDRIVTYYGARFDLPYIRTKAVKWGIDFPPYGVKYSTDVWMIIKHKFRLHSNRLDVACRAILGKSDKTYLDTDIWMEASYGGDKEALDYILEHNKNDVSDLKELYKKVVDYQRPTRTSI